jgi:hypothetical protein
MSQYLNLELGDKMMGLASQYLISIIDKGLYKINNFLQDDIEKTLPLNFYPYSSEEQIIEFQNILKDYTFNNEEINELINEFYYNAVVDIHGEYEGTLEEYEIEYLPINIFMDVCISLIFGLNKYYYVELVISLNSSNTYTSLK